MGGGSKRKDTDTQKEFFRKLPSELEQQCRDAFSNTTKRTSHVAKSNLSLLTESGLVEWPVIMMFVDVTATPGQKIGTLIDLASDTNHITHEEAGWLNLRSEGMMLVVHGVRRMKAVVRTKQ